MDQHSSLRYNASFSEIFGKSNALREIDTNISANVIPIEIALAEPSTLRSYKYSVYTVFTNRHGNENSIEAKA